jgi:hypothetical protein
VADGVVVIDVVVVVFAAADDVYVVFATLVL